MDKLVSFRTTESRCQIPYRRRCHARNTGAELLVAVEGHDARTSAKDHGDNVTEVAGRQRVQDRIQVSDWLLARLAGQLVRQRHERSQLGRGGAGPADDMPADTHAREAGKDQDPAIHGRVPRKVWQAPVTL